MTRWASLSFIAVLFLLPSRGLAAFASCEDAHNYGENSGRLYVSQTFARMDCDEVLLETIHNALARMIATQVIETSDSDQEKLCFYEGLWDGLVGQLSEEYAACGAWGRLSCIDRATLAAEAGAMLRAISGTFDEDAVLSNAAMTWVYEIEDGLISGAPLCEELAVSSCSVVVRDRAGPRVAGRLGALVPTIAEAVCN